MQETPEAGPSEEVAVAGKAPLVTYEQFLKHLKYDAEHDEYIVEGDIPLKGEKELRAYYDDTFGPSGALLVDTRPGYWSLWDRTQRWNITYCVSPDFGANYNKVRDSLRKAVGAWENVADVRFPHLSQYDTSSCNTSLNGNGVVFNVRPTSGQDYYAKAFSPYYPNSRRNLLIDGSAFSAFDLAGFIGLLTHELGHTLGFRHEHIRRSANDSDPFCAEPEPNGGITYAELTGDDGYSVMNYSECSGYAGGPAAISQRDMIGAESVYEAPTNVVVSNGVVRARQRSTGNFCAFDSSSGTWSCPDSPSTSYVRGGLGVYALQAGTIWHWYLTGWSDTGGRASHIFECPAESICATTEDGNSTTPGGVWYLSPAAGWQYIGNHGAKFASNYSKILRLRAQRDRIALYSGTEQTWTTLPGGGALDLFGGGQQYIYRVSMTGDQVDRYNGSSSSPWTTVSTYSARQWVNQNVYLYSIGLNDNNLWRHNSDGSRTLIDGDSVRIYTSDESSAPCYGSCVYVTDTAENIWKYNSRLANPWTYLGHP